MAEGKAAASSLFGLTKFSEAAKRSDVVFALGIMAILTVLILPMPKGLLDVCLALSLMISMLVLTTALFIERPLEFSSFPTLLLVSTMLRLSLNVASTRLILGHGHEGLSAAGEVIRAFGAFIMQGNFVIGLIVFAILVLALRSVCLVVNSVSVLSTVILKTVRIQIVVHIWLGMVDVLHSPACNHGFVVFCFLVLQLLMIFRSFFRLNFTI